MPSINPDPLIWAHPIVREWFISHFPMPTEPQVEGWPSILKGESTLISAPTGSGKTLAAFFVCIEQLVRKALAQGLEDKTEVLYISPLKALSNDIQKNLLTPLHGITSLARTKGLCIQEVRAVVRTGDTLPRDRQAMLKKPPHILVTTPESLYILLTSAKSREMLRSVKTVIVDEIHAVADDKRGSHLALSLERLEALVEQPLLRIGLSATQKPMEVVAQFLVGVKRPLPKIVNIGHTKQLELTLEVPDIELGPVASNEMWDNIYDRIVELSNENRSTLVFVNTRRLAERVAHHLGERLGEDKVAAHHGSLSRKLRLLAEHRLKEGELKVLVATASLELGIDIGSIDLVCQLGSPRAISVALQRVGRAGHWHGAISKGALFATTRDELVECAAVIEAIKDGELDQLIIPTQPLDVLAQQIVASCVSEEWQEIKLFELFKQAYSYRDLTFETFLTVVKMLSEGIAGSRGRYGAYLYRDSIQGSIKARRGARITAITSGGAIPDNGLFTVVAEPQQNIVGTLDEDFAVESNRGDIILLGSTSWQIRRVESASGRVLVEDAHGAPPSVPFWRGEAPARSLELSRYVSDLREKVSNQLAISIKTFRHQADHPDIKNCITWLNKHCGLNQSGAEQLIEYILLGRALLGTVPTQQKLIAERCFDETGGMQLIIHSPFGARINKAWGLALRKKFCRSFNFELQAAATDNGINISLAEQHSFPLGDVFHFLHTNTLKNVVTQAVLQSPLFITRWRWTASRSLALSRFRFGKKVPPNIQRALADDLLAAVFPDASACQDNLAGQDIIPPDHPLVFEALKDSLTEAMDIEGLMSVIQSIQDETIQCIAVDTPTPSAFAHEILNANPYAYLDDAPLEERRARAIEMRRMLPETLLQEVGQLDESAIELVMHDAKPDIRSAEELHDVMQTLIALPQTFTESDPDFQHWQGLMHELTQRQTGVIAYEQGICMWMAVEKVETFKQIYPQAIFPRSPIPVEQTIPQREDALLDLLRGWLLHLGPTRADKLSNLLYLSISEIDAILLRLEATGLILRGQFTHDVSALEWCERRLLARIHKLTVGRLRQEIAPVPSATFMRWLCQWQHLTSDSQLQGEQGLLNIIRQLQGFEIPANRWERQIFSKRLLDYQMSMLDQLCLTGVVGWGRLSSHPLMLDEHHDTTKKIAANSSIPITFFLREQAANLILKKPKVTENLEQLSFIALSIYEFLQQKGASFFPDILYGVKHLAAEVEQGLWELVAAGLITADGFDNLRSLIDKRRRLRKGRRSRFTLASGARWSLLQAYGTDEITAKQLEATCWQLLTRYGVVFRDLIVREKNLPRWRDLLMTFRRLEDRGEIRGGRFVSGFLGEQFALPSAVESLRICHKSTPDDHVITLTSADPLNLVGILLPGERVAVNSKVKIRLKNGVVVEE
ncbi:MAG: DEAD/DEAH box helicase [Gammaproteobacteria bacterium]|nr:DEAD/DEAH box helicase [Gammaproteobacteria bacterium]